MSDTDHTFELTAWRDGRPQPEARRLAEETAVAISYNGSTHAVLMATPADLEDLAVGFSFTEGIVADIDAIEDVRIVAFDAGLDLQIRISSDIAARLAARRRSMAGPVGCGLCGLESLEAATRELPSVLSSATFEPSSIVAAARSLADHQPLNAATGAVHAAGFFGGDGALSCVREDVGRHNALDKLIGALLRAGSDPSGGGFVVTSRVSVELVQKTAIAGCGLLAAISAPTAYAIRTAALSNITIAAVVRGADFEVFSHSGRIRMGTMADVP